VVSAGLKINSTAAQISVNFLSQSYSACLNNSYFRHWKLKVTKKKSMEAVVAGGGVLLCWGIVKLGKWLGCPSP